MRRLFLCLLLIAAIVLSGCQVRSTVRVDLQGDGSGTVSVIVRLDKEAADAMPNLRQDLDTSDLVRSGWSISGPTEINGGTVQVTARHGFDSPEEATQLLRGLSGSGPPFTNFKITQERSFTHVESHFSGELDMREGISSFGDIGLTQSVGSKLGFDPNELQRSLGVDWPQTFPVDVVVNLPNGIKDATPEMDDNNTWHAIYGESISLSASSEGPNWKPLVLFGVSALSLIACILVLIFWRKGTYNPRHGPDAGGKSVKEFLREVGRR